MNKIKKAFKTRSLVGLGLLATATASQAAVDVTAVVSTIGEGAAAVGLIGVAVLTVWAIKKVYSLIGGR